MCILNHHVPRALSGEGRRRNSLTSIRWIMFHVLEDHVHHTHDRLTFYGDNVCHRQEVGCLPQKRKTLSTWCLIMNHTVWVQYIFRSTSFLLRFMLLLIHHQSQLLCCQSSNPCQDASCQYRKACGTAAESRLYQKCMSTHHCMFLFSLTDLYRFAF